MSREVENEQEMLNKEEQAVSRLVGSLKHAEAPANFERRVLARIAERKRKKPSLFAFPAVAYAVPALFVILLTTFFVLKLRQQTPARPATVASDIISTPPKPENPVPVSTATVAPNSSDSTVAQVGNEKPAPKSTVRRKGGSVEIPEINDSNKGGSTVYTVREKKGPMPEGVDPEARIPVKSVLDGAGMSVEFENGWQVKSVSENGIAQKAGIKAGDVITALDGRSIDSTTSYKGTASFQTITVRRGGSFVLLRISPR